MRACVSECEGLNGPVTNTCRRLHSSCAGDSRPNAEFSPFTCTSRSARGSRLSSPVVRVKPLPLQLVVFQAVYSRDYPTSIAIACTGQDKTDNTTRQHYITSNRSTLLRQGATKL